MMNFPAGEGTAPGYLALPAGGRGPGVVVLHTWWGLTDPFRRVCDQLAAEGFVALAPDLYHGKTTASAEEAQALGDALDQDMSRWRGEIAGAVQELHRRSGPQQRESPTKVGFVGFSLGGSYALDMSVNLAEEVAAVVTFYVAWAEPEFARARAAYLFHFAEQDPFEAPGAAAEMEQAIRAAGPSLLTDIPGPNIGSSRTTARSMMPTRLAWPGSAPSRSCTNIWASALANRKCSGFPSQRYNRREIS